MRSLMIVVCAMMVLAMVGCQAPVDPAAHDKAETTRLEKERKAIKNNTKSNLRNLASKDAVKSREARVKLLAGGQPVIDAAYDLLTDPEVGSAAKYALKFVLVGDATRKQAFQGLSSGDSSFSTASFDILDAPEQTMLTATGARDAVNTERDERREGDEKLRKELEKETGDRVAAEAKLTSKIETAKTVAENAAVAANSAKTEAWRLAHEAAYANAQANIVVWAALYAARSAEKSCDFSEETARRLDRFSEKTKQANEEAARAERASQQANEKASRLEGINQKLTADLEAMSIRQVWDPCQCCYVQQIWIPRHGWVKR